MQAFWQRSVVVSDPCFPHPLFKPGQHYFEEAPRHIPELIRWILASKDGAERAETMRANAFCELSTRANLDAAAKRILAFMEAA
jgi:hypothetical protein